jgi:hypothetical protein
VCNHCTEDGNAECNYTPKKRHKVPLEQGTASERPIAPYGNKAASFLVSDMSMVEDLTKSNGDPEGHRFYGQNIASSSRLGASPTPHSFERGGAPEVGASHMSSSGRYTPDFQSRVWSSRSQISHLPAKPSSGGLSFISHSFPGDQGILISRSLVDPWSHPSFTPLPDLMLQRLATVNSVEMPNRQSFVEALELFLSELMPELRETAVLSPDLYAKIWRCITKGDTSKLSDRLRGWLTYHHVRSGSDRNCLLIVPRDKYFTTKTEDAEELRLQYIARLDGQVNGHTIESSTTLGRSKDSIEHGLDPLEWSAVFERIPVQNQIYDILVYCHRAHGSSTSMLFEARRLGMVAISFSLSVVVRLGSRDFQGNRYMANG